MALKPDTVQYPITAIVDIAYGDLTDATAVDVLALPQGAVITAMDLVVDTAWNSATSDTFDIGDATDPDRYTSSPVSVATTGVISGVAITGYEGTSSDTYLQVTWDGTGTAPSAGAARLIVQYIVDGRFSEVAD